MSEVKVKKARVLVKTLALGDQEIWTYAHGRSLVLLPPEKISVREAFCLARLWAAQGREVRVVGGKGDKVEVDWRSL